MPDYSLRFPNRNGSGEEEYHFTALSLDGALNIAKQRVNSHWAVLSEEGKAICRMQLVDETGAWLIGRPDTDG